MKILYVGNAQGFHNGSKYYFIPQRLVNGFTRLGHNVYVFNDRDYAHYSSLLRRQNWGKRKMNMHLVALCLDYRPDLIVLGHCKNVSNDTLAEIREVCPEVKIIYRNVDPLSSVQNVNDIKDRIGHVDNIYITTAGPSLSRFSSKVGGVYFMPNPVDRSLDTVRAHENDSSDIDLLFLASYLRDQKDHRSDIAKFLLNYEGELNLKIGGAGVNNNKIYGAKYYDFLARSKMGLCINKTSDYYLYASDRMSQYMSAGLLVYAPVGPQFEDVLGQDTFISFDTHEDLLEKIRYFKRHDMERQKIAQNGYNKVHDVFAVEKICQFMIETTFDLPFSLNYQWPQERY